MEARPLPAFNSKKRKSIHPTRQLLDLHLQTLSGGPRRAEKKRVANTPRCCAGLPAECKSEGRAEKMAAVRPCCAAGSLVAELAGERLLQSVLRGRNQAGATSCLWRARTSRRLLASPGTVRPRDQPCHNSSSPVISPRLGRALCITGGRLDCRAREWSGIACLFLAAPTSSPPARTIPGYRTGISRGQRSHITVSAGQGSQIGARVDGVS